MPVTWVLALIAILAFAGYFLGRQRALTSAGNDRRNLHSLPAYYGLNVALTTLLPAAALMVVWSIAQPLYIENRVAADIPQSMLEDGKNLNLVMSDVRRVAEGLDLAVEMGVMTPDRANSIRTEFTDVRDRLAEIGVALGSNVSAGTLRAAQVYRSMSSTGNWILIVLALLAAGGGFAYSYLRTDKRFRARNIVESGILLVLIAAACVAIFTTIGIVLSLFFNTLEFFEVYPWQDFFLSLTWQPSFGGGSDLGIWPLLWGTFYISIVALVVSVPIGLFAAIYLSEYAGPRVRGIVKPALEILAGIPTIVYGLFALLTVGPLLVSVFGDDGLGIMQSATAVMTAGLVMGIMLIPFVSSLSDDVINAVPQAMRDGAYGLGSTKSETIKNVILPAALPGIVGAILLAASRAIGETMIVVLGAGAAARMSLNPFEAMTTVTAKIVSQLTGDSDFSSPEALVAFALGMTLFIITLTLNAFALYIVRKYREQYE